MAINHTQREMPTGGGNPTAGAINILHFPTATRPGKAFETLRAAFALQGHSLRQTEQADGPVSYWTERWELVRYLHTLHDAPLFLAQIGGRL